MALARPGATLLKIGEESREQEGRLQEWLSKECQEVEVLFHQAEMIKSADILVTQPPAASWQEGQRGHMGVVTEEEGTVGTVEGSNGQSDKSTPDSYTMSEVAQMNEMEERRQKEEITEMEIL